MSASQIDIKENNIIKLDKKLLEILLKDRTTTENIIWATDIYESYNGKYKSSDNIQIESISGENGKVIRPRIDKSQKEQKHRIKDKAEVFTPSWICNEQNNLVDEAWFERKNVFNVGENKTWSTNKEKISFPNGKTWQDYVKLNVLEITCGEAPYLASRYDTTTGEWIEVGNRIGVLDRKIRIVNENTTDEKKWYAWVLQAYKSTYGYEWQGDSLLIARENLLYTFIDYYKDRYGTAPTNNKLCDIANILSWNLWQMDGLKCVVPNSCKNESSLYKNIYDKKRTCGACLKRKDSKHNGIYCKITKWKTNKRVLFNTIQGGREMKFDFVIGNPPYQEANSQNKMSRSVYPDFVKIAKKVGRVVSLIMPARWMSGENGPYRETSGFIDEMIEGNHLKSFVLYPNSIELFKNVDIKGGVCLFCYDKKYSKDEIKYTLSEYGQNKESIVSFREVKNIIIRFPELLSILKKSRNPSSDSMRTLVSSRNPFGFVSDLFIKNNEGVSRISDTKKQEDDYLIHGLLNTKRVVKYIPNSALKKNIEGAKNYKVFIPRANGSGVFGEVFSTPMIGVPMSICTDTFLQVGLFKNENEAKNLLKYIKSKYFRAMVGIRKTAVFNYKDCFEFVPLQDFSNDSDIDWSKSIEDIDRQLYKKYDLNDEEINFIESHIKEMS